MNDKWDDELKPDSYQITMEDNSNVITRVGGGFSFIFATQITNSGISIWRFKIRQIKIKRIGFFPSKAVKKSFGAGDAMAEPERLLFYHDGDVRPFFSKYVYDPDSSKNVMEFSCNGDILCIIFNAMERTISYSVNSSPLMIRFENIPIENNYKLGVCILNGGVLELQASAHLEPTVL